MAATATIPTRPASPYAGYPYPYTRDFDNPNLPGVPHRPKIVAEGIPWTWNRTVAYIAGQAELRRRRKWYDAHQKDIDKIVDDEPPHPVEAKQWSDQCMNAMRFFRRCCMDKEKNPSPLESVHVDCCWYGGKTAKGRAIETGTVRPNYTLKCHRCRPGDYSNEEEEIRPHPDEEWWCAMCDSEGCEKDDYDPMELLEGQEYVFGWTIKELSLIHI